MKDKIWSDGPYFPTPPPDSADGGMTNEGPLWHAITPRWGHSMHSMCSYQGMFPARLVHYFVQAYTRAGDRVMDPFSGRGTSVLQSRMEGRIAIGGDLNPLAFVLTRAKAAPPPWDGFVAYLNSLEETYTPEQWLHQEVSPDIRMLFSSHTLAQLQYLRATLMRRPWSKWSDRDFMLAGCIAGILHGGHRADGSSAYLSISMPNTFSMSPAYVRKFILANGLKPPEHNIFSAVKTKAARVYKDAIDGPRGSAHLKDAIALLQDRRAVSSSSIDLLLTSPPYLRVVNYGTSNWIRLWWLGVEDVGRENGEGRLALDARLDHRHTYETYREFMRQVFEGTCRVLRPDGVAIFVIGDVAEPGRPPFQLATSIWEDAGESTGLRLIAAIEDRLQAKSKVSRIWGETRGQATECDRILIVGRRDGQPRQPKEGPISWEEPYKDAGPDAAYRHLEGLRLNQNLRSDNRDMGLANT